MLSRNQKSAETCEQDVTPDQLSCSGLGIVSVFSVFCILSFGDRTRRQLTKKLAGKGARISSYFIYSYSLNTA